MKCVIEEFGEAGLSICLQHDAGKKIDLIEIGVRANLLADRLRASTQWIDVTAGLDTVVVRFDVMKTDLETARRTIIKTVNALEDDQQISATRFVELPVLYGDEHGPDLKALCHSLDLREEELITRHTQKSLRVITMGFAPGFAYLGPINSSLKCQRRAKPRILVPAGSIALAGDFTGIYSLASPGGWQIIGQTPLTLAEPEQEIPFKLDGYTKVQFRAISKEEFLDLKADHQSRAAIHNIGEPVDEM